MMLLYFVFPLDPNRAPVGVLVGVIGSIVAIVGISAVVVMEVNREERRLTVMHLVLGLQVVLMVFSSAYYLIESLNPGQIVGLSTRLDALYFSITTAATVGFGDIHAEGQFARGLVAAHITFNILFLGAFANLVRDQVSHRREHASDEQRP